jgi:hypothetical protein
MMKVDDADTRQIPTPESIPLRIINRKSRGELGTTVRIFSPKSKMRRSYLLQQERAEYKF